MAKQKQSCETYKGRKILNIFASRGQSKNHSEKQLNPDTYFAFSVLEWRPCLTPRKLLNRTQDNSTKHVKTTRPFKHATCKQPKTCTANPISVSLVKTGEGTKESVFSQNFLLTAEHRVLLKVNVQLWVWIGNQNTDLTIRLSTRGWICMVAPSAIILPLNDLKSNNH